MESGMIDKYFYQIIGEKLSEIRHKKGYTLDYMSKQIGISKQAYDLIELGKTKISLSRFKTICNLLEISNEIKLFISLE